MKRRKHSKLIEDASMLELDEHVLFGTIVGLDPDRCFLSTFYRAPFDPGDGKLYVSVEHYYQCEKYNHRGNFPNPETLLYYELLVACDSNMKAVCLGCKTKHRYSAKWPVNREHSELGTVNQAIDQYASAAQRVPDWHSKNVETMHSALLKRFRDDPALSEQLRATAPKQLVYLQSKGEFWSYGKHTPVLAFPAEHTGQNQLGQLLVEIRNTLSKK